MTEDERRDTVLDEVRCAGNELPSYGRKDGIRCWRSTEHPSGHCWHHRDQAPGVAPKEEEIVRLHDALVWIALRVLHETGDTRWQMTQRGCWMTSPTSPKLCSTKQENPPQPVSTVLFLSRRCVAWPMP